MRIYGTGSAACVGSDNTCLNSLFKNELSLSIYFFFNILYSSQSEEPKNSFVGIFEYILASMLKVFLDM